MDLVEYIYKATSNYPSEEKYALSNQMRRASVSIASNIAEGYGRGTDKDLTHFLFMAKGSSNELAVQIDLSQRLNFMDEKTFNQIEPLNMEVNKMLSSLIYRRQNKLDSFGKSEA